jgi:hypothetical protein
VWNFHSTPLFLSLLSRPLCQCVCVFVFLPYQRAYLHNKILIYVIIYSFSHIPALTLLSFISVSSLPRYCYCCCCCVCGGKKMLCSENEHSDFVFISLITHTFLASPISPTHFPCLAYIPHCCLFDCGLLAHTHTHTYTHACNKKEEFYSAATSSWGGLVKRRDGKESSDRVF